MISSSHFFKKTFFTLQIDEKKWTKPILSPWIDSKPISNLQRQKTQKLIKLYRYQKSNEQQKLAKQQSIYKRYILNLQNFVQDKPASKDNNKRNSIPKFALKQSLQNEQQELYVNNTIIEYDNKKMSEMLALRESRMTKMNNIRKGNNKYCLSTRLQKGALQSFQLHGKKTRKLNFSSLK